LNILLATANVAGNIRLKPKQRQVKSAQRSLHTVY